jgi:hypothetical protein
MPSPYKREELIANTATLVYLLYDLDRPPASPYVQTVSHLNWLTALPSYVGRAEVEGEITGRWGGGGGGLDNLLMSMIILEMPNLIKRRISDRFFFL